MHLSIHEKEIALNFFKICIIISKSVRNKCDVRLENSCCSCCPFDTFNMNITFFRHYELLCMTISVIWNYKIDFMTFIRKLYSIILRKEINIKINDNFGIFAPSFKMIWKIIKSTLQSLKFLILSEAFNSIWQDMKNIQLNFPKLGYINLTTCYITYINLISIY